MASRGLGRLTLDLVAQIGGFTGPLSKAERELDARTRRMNKMANDFGRAIGGSLKAAAGQFLAFAGVAVSLDAAVGAIKGAIDRADQLRDASIRLGVGVETLSAYGFAAQQTGTDLEELNKGLLRLSKNATAALDPKSKQAGLFGALGVDRAALTDLDKLLPQIADAFAGLEDGATKAALAQELFGRSGANLIEFLNQGGDGLQQMTDRARELGIVIDQETADAADEFNDKLAELKASGTGLATQVASELLPQLTELVNWATDFVSDGDNAKQVADGLSDAFKFLADAIQVAAEVGGPLLDFLDDLRSAAASAESALGKLNPAGYAGTGEMLRKQFPALYRTIGGDSAPGGGTSERLAPVTLGRVTVQGDINEFARAEAARIKKDRELQDKINAFLGGGRRTSGSSGRSASSKSGKSEAQRETEQLQQSYDRLNASLAEQIALFGQTTEAAKVRYDIENGELAKLTQAKKDGLIAQAEALDMKRAEAEVQRELDAVNERREENTRQLLEDLKFEAELLGKTREEQEILNNLRYAGVDANSAYGQSVIDATKALQEQSRMVADEIAVADGARDAFKGFLYDLREGKGLWDSLTDAALNFLDVLFEIAAQKAVDQIFGQQGTTQSGSSGFDWGQLLSSFFGSYGGGRASGGSVGAGQWYRVNENGPELLSVSGKDYLMMGAAAGRITPAHALAGGGGRSISQTFVTAGVETRRTSERKAQLAGREAQRAMARTGR